MLKLYHNTDLIGIIKSADSNGFDMHGKIELTEKAAAFKPVFEFFENPENDSVEPPFAEDILWNWKMVDEDGKSAEVGLPGIFDEADGTHIMWRYL